GQKLAAKPDVRSRRGARRARARAQPPRVAAPPQLSMPAIPWPRLTVPAISWPRLTMPTPALPRLRMPRVPRIAWVVAAIVAILLIAPLAYVLLPSGRTAAARPGALGHLPATNGATAGETLQAGWRRGLARRWPDVWRWRSLVARETRLDGARSPDGPVAAIAQGERGYLVVFAGGL